MQPRYFHGHSPRRTAHVARFALSPPRAVAHGLASPRNALSRTAHHPTTDYHAQIFKQHVQRPI
jgi:hypothetical protein